MSDRRSDPGVVSPGTFEIDFARELGRDVQVAAATVLGPGGAALTVAFVDFHLFGGLVPPRGRLPVESGFHVQAGRFDVPFGNDWQRFASKDRTEASAPLTTEDLMGGGANDVGVRLLGASGSADYSAFVLRGPGAGLAWGGRLAIAPLRDPFRLQTEPGGLEAGVSLLHDVDAGGATRKVAVAFDSEALVGRLHVRAEYVRTDARPVEGRWERAVRRGWHVTAAVDAGCVGAVRIVPYARYDTVTGEPERGAEAAAGARRESRTERFTAGLNGALFGRLTLKAEYRRLFPARPAACEGGAPAGDSFLAQAVVAW